MQLHLRLDVSILSRHIKCPAGYSNANACRPCPDGQWSAEGAISCNACPTAEAMICLHAVRVQWLVCRRPRHLTRRATQTWSPDCGTFIMLKYTAQIFYRLHYRFPYISICCLLVHFAEVLYAINFYYYFKFFYHDYRRYSSGNDGYARSYSTRCSSYSLRTVL